MLQVWGDEVDVLRLAGSLMRLAALGAGTALLASCTTSPVRTAPNPAWQPIDQRALSAQACGPASLLNSFGSGSSRWQAAAQVPGNTSREKLSYVLRRYALHPSDVTSGRRWSRRGGVNLADLTDMANEMAAPHQLPHLRNEVLFRGDHEAPTELLNRAHRRLAESLRRGLPPVVSVRRSLKQPRTTAEMLGASSRGHFLVITEVPRTLDDSATSFSISYIDPWGGQRRTGSIRITSNASVPCLEAVLPQSEIGMRELRTGKDSLLTLSSVLGSW